MVWVWASERAPEEEDGSQLYLVNLQLVQEGFSSQKSASGSTYSDAIYDADLQAQRLKKHIYSNDVDPLFYEGDALTNELDIFQHPENYVGKKVNVSGIVTRIVGTNAYFQKTFYMPRSSRLKLCFACIRHPCKDENSNILCTFHQWHMMILQKI